MGRKGETREKGPAPAEWNKFVRQICKLVRECKKAQAREKLRKLRKKYAHPGAQNLKTPGRSLIKPAEKPSIGKKRIQKAVKNSRS